MFNLDKLKRIVNSAIDIVNTPDSFHHGEDFEKFAKALFPLDKYNILSQTNSYLQNKDGYVKQSLEPDYKFEVKKGLQFYVECKYRSDFYKNKLNICKDINQLNRYREIDKKTPVLMMVGLGDKPKAPEFVFLIPIKKIKYTDLYESQLEQFYLDLEKYPTISPFYINKLLQ